MFHSYGLSYQCRDIFFKFWHQSYFLSDSESYVCKMDNLSREDIFLNRELVSFFKYHFSKYMKTAYRGSLQQKNQSPLQPSCSKCYGTLWVSPSLPRLAQQGEPYGTSNHLYFDHYAPEANLRFHFSQLQFSMSFSFLNSY